MFRVFATTSEVNNRRLAKKIRLMWITVDVKVDEDLNAEIIVSTDSILTYIK